MTKRKILPNPNYTLWKALLGGFYMNAVVTFFSWMYKILLEPGRYKGLKSTPPSFPPLTFEDVIIGSGFWVCLLWIFWSWRSRRKHAHWHRWLSGLLCGLYFSGLLLVGAVVIFSRYLHSPLSWTVNGFAVVLFLVLSGLPLISRRIARKIESYLWGFSGKMIGLSGVAGTLGALFAMSAARSGHMGLGLRVMALLMLLLSLIGAFGTTNYYWEYRPWAKEEE